MIFSIVLAALTAQAGPPTAVALPPQPALTEAITARDSALFTLIFERCDPQELRTMLTGDFEMYHDRGGVIARDADAMVADYARSCAAAAQPDAWRSRRALVAETLRVDPVPGYGAIEAGEHVFYERQGNGPERLAGRARFVNLWVLSPDGWRLSRVFSFAHEAAS